MLDDVSEQPLNVDGFVKSPISALRFILCSLRCTKVRLIPRNSRRLKLDFLRNHQCWTQFKIKI